MRELMFEVITIEEARQRIMENWRPDEKVEKIGITDAWNRIAAEDLVAAENVPGFDRSTMDGYAVNAEDTFGASESLPAYLSLVGEVPMGSSPEMNLGLDEATAAATGSKLPEGANAVVMLERAEAMADGTIAVYKPVAPGENVMERGEDVIPGQVVVPKGTLLRAQELGIISSLGIVSVQVYRPYKVGIISTGNELVTPWQKPGLGQIRDSNSYTLLGLVKEAGGIPILYDLVPDEEDAFRNTFAVATKESDLVLVSGGSSVGTRDLTLNILEEFGEVLFHGVAIKPGKPTLAATVKGQDDTLIVGLPGHPVSAFVAFQELVRPALKRHLKTTVPKAVVWGELQKNVPSQAGREEHVRVRLFEDQGKVFVEPIFGKSGMLSTLSRAHGIMVIPLEAQGLAAGTRVPVTLFKEL